MSQNSPQVQHGYESHLAPLTGNGFRIGYVDFMHGEKGATASGYPVTRHELEILAQHWSKTVIDINRRWLSYEQFGSEDLRIRPYGLERLGMLAEVIGKEAVRAIFERTAEAIDKAERSVVRFFEDEAAEAIKAMGTGEAVDEAESEGTVVSLSPEEYDRALQIARKRTAAGWL